MKKSYLLPCLILLICIFPFSPATAQVHLGLNGFFFKPQGELSQSGYLDGGGLGLEVSSRDLMPNFFLNLRWGVHLDYSWNGSRSLQLETDPWSYTETTLAITNQSVGGHVFGRLITKGDRMRWYMDYFLGLRYFLTTETFLIRDLTSSDYDDYETQIDFAHSNPAPYRGWSLGVEYHLSPTMFLDLRMTRAKGGSASFADLETVALYGNQVNYNLEQSHDTHNLVWLIGVTFKLGRDKTQKSRQSSPATPAPAPDPNQGELNKTPLPKY